MITLDKFCDIQNDCNVLIDALDVTVNYAGKLLGFTGIYKQDDYGNPTELQPYAAEHFDNLQKAAKQISSYADRLNNKLNAFKNAIDQVY